MFHTNFSIKAPRFLSQLQNISLDFLMALFLIRCLALRCTSVTSELTAEKSTPSKDRMTGCLLEDEASMILQGCEAAGCTNNVPGIMEH